jgi:hypothetical protein
MMRAWRQCLLMVLGGWALVGAAQAGELIGGNFLRSVDDLAVSGKFPRWTYDTIPGA